MQNLWPQRAQCSASGKQSINTPFPSTAPIRLVEQKKSHCNGKLHAKTAPRFYKEEEHIDTWGHIAQPELKFWHIASLPLHAYQRRQTEHGSAVSREGQKRDGWIILPPLSDTTGTVQKEVLARFPPGTLKPHILTAPCLSKGIQEEKNKQRPTCIIRLYKC